MLGSDGSAVWVLARPPARLCAAGAAAWRRMEAQGIGASWGAMGAGGALGKSTRRAEIPSCCLDGMTGWHGALDSSEVNMMFFEEACFPFERLLRSHQVVSPTWERANAVRGFFAGVVA